MVALVAVAAMIHGMSWGRGQERDVLELDIQAGEPFGDAMARSSLKHDVGIPLDMQRLGLPRDDTWNGERFQVALRGSEEQRAVIPWTPAQGVLWMNAGVVDEISLEFVNFHRTRADSPDWTPPEMTHDAPPGPLDEEIEAIVEIYESVLSLAHQPAEPVNCYRNSLEIPRGACERVTMATGRLSPDELRATLRIFHAKFTHDWQNDPTERNKVAQTLNLGQWWLPNGSLMMLIVMPNRNFALGEDPDRHPPGLALSLNVAEFFRAGLSRLIPACYDQQAIFPDRMVYSQAQAAHIFHGLYDDFYPPTVDGRTVTDPIELARLDWGQFSAGYRSDPATRRGFCELLRELELEAGYEGPFAPLR